VIAEAPVYRRGIASLEVLDHHVKHPGHRKLSVLQSVPHTLFYVVSVALPHYWCAGLLPGSRALQGVAICHTVSCRIRSVSPCRATLGG
jgi:hypothetical protein